MEFEHNLRRLENIVGYYGDSRLEMLSQLIRAGNWLRETKSLRTASADLVRKLRPLNGLVVRSKRRDMDWDLPKRKAVTLDLQLTKKEWHLYLAAKNWSLRLIELRNPDDEHYDWALLCMKYFRVKIKIRGPEELYEDNDCIYLSRRFFY